MLHVPGSRGPEVQAQLKTMRAPSRRRKNRPRVEYVGGLASMRGSRTVEADPTMMVGINPISTHKRGKTEYEPEAVPERLLESCPSYIGEQAYDLRQLAPGSIWAFACDTDVFHSPDQGMPVVSLEFHLHNVFKLRPAHQLGMFTKGTLAVMLQWLERWERRDVTVSSWGGGSTRSQTLHCTRPVFIVDGRPCIIADTNLLAPV